MKKILALVLAMTLVLALAGCSKSSGSGSDDNTVGSGGIVKPEDGFAEGRVGDTMRTDFFDFKINSGTVVQDYNGYTAPEGMELLLVNVTVTNTFSESIPMYADDFQAQWGDDDDNDAYAYPIEEEGLGDAQLPIEYELAVKEERTGELVFEVPAGNKDFSVSHMVWFDDGTEEGKEGDTFFVYFTAYGSTATA